MTCHVKIKWSKRNYPTFHKGASTQRRRKKTLFILSSRFSPRTSYISRIVPNKKPPLPQCSPTPRQTSLTWERLINVASRVDKWNFERSKTGRRRGWARVFLSLCLGWAQVRQSKSWRRHRVRIVEQKESFACRARIYCLAGMSSVSATDVDEWIKRKHEVWIIESGRVRKIQKQSCKVCDGFKKTGWGGFNCCRGWYLFLAFFSPLQKLWICISSEWNQWRERF